MFPGNHLGDTAGAIDMTVASAEEVSAQGSGESVTNGAPKRGELSRQLTRCPSYLAAFFRATLGTVSVLLRIIFFPPAAFPYFAKITYRLMGRFLIFPLEPFQLTFPAIAIGPVLCLLTFYGFPEPFAAIIFVLVQIYVSYAASSNATWGGARNFIQWMFIAVLLFVLTGYYFQVPLFAKLCETVANLQVPFPPQLIFLYAGTFLVVYFVFLVHQMFILRVSVKRGRGGEEGEITIMQWGAKSTTYSISNYDFECVLHDATEGPYGCRGINLLPRQPGVNGYEFSIVSGGKTVEQLLNNAKNRG